MIKGLHAHRLFYLPMKDHPGIFTCLCCDQRFRNHEQAHRVRCNAATIHLTAVPKRDNPAGRKHPGAITLEMCGTRTAHLPKEHAHLPAQLAIDEGVPANTCLACIAELNSPTMQGKWTPLR